MAPVLDELAGEYTGRVKFVILDIEDNKVVSSHEGVSGTPTLFFYKKGRLADRVVGAVPRSEIARHLDSLIAGA